MAAYMLILTVLLVALVIVYVEHKLKQYKEISKTIEEYFSEVPK
jgi:hypothetical protein